MGQEPTVKRRQDAVKWVDASTDHGDAVSELVVHVFRLDGLLRSVGDALAEPAGQSTARWRVLAAVEHGPLTVADIARAWWLARQSVQRLADVLAAEGLVTYRTNPAHRRAQLVELTTRGRTVLGHIRTAQSEWADTVGQQIGTRSLMNANRVLTRVIAAVDNLATALDSDASNGQSLHR